MESQSQTQQKVKIVTPFWDNVIIPEKTPKTKVEKYLNITFGSSQLHNAIKLAEAVAEKKGSYIDIPEEKVLYARFSHSENFAHAWILLHNGIAIDVSISVKEEPPRMRIAIYPFHKLKYGIEV
jgi:hypothetical protein